MQKNQKVKVVHSTFHHERSTYKSNSSKLKLIKNESKWYAEIRWISFDFNFWYHLNVAVAAHWSHYEQFNNDTKAFIKKSVNSDSSCQINVAD